MKRIVFRADGSSKLGMGHIVRCLALAKYIARECSWEIVFYSKDDPTGVKAIQNAGFPVFTIPSYISDAEAERAFINFILSNPFDVVINDVGPTTTDYVLAIKEKGVCLVTLDDEGVGAPLADAVICCYPVARPNPNGYYGSKYALLRNDFLFFNNKTKVIPMTPKNILVTTGGADVDNLTQKILDALLLAQWSEDVYVVLGPAVPEDYKKTIMRSTKDDLKIKLLCDVSKMAELMFNSDMAVFCGGTTRFELAATGTPSIALCYNEKQNRRVKDFCKSGCCLNLGIGKEVSRKRLAAAISDLSANYHKRLEMSTAGKRAVDGRGVERAVKIIKCACGG
ncbi:MAG: hypothetical protein H0Z39_11460 [Peptococcaceae bacterium]|nr:hypothetical protein [Peptococcaceae bacterium]